MNAELHKLDKHRKASSSSSSTFYGTWLFQRLSSRTAPRGSQSLRWTLGEGMTRRCKLALYGFYFFYCRMCIHGISSESVYKNVQLTTWHSCSGVSQFLASRLFKLVRDMSVTTELKSNVQIMLPSLFLSLSLSAGSNTFLQSTERKNKPQLILCLRL